jgi:uncharacterized membrane protein YkvA (DUF1232 family)
MWKRVLVIWTLVRSDARLLLRALKHPLSPSWLKWGVAGIALYLLSPIDLIPDFIPVLGLMDDIFIVPLAIRWLLGKLPGRVRADIETKATA